MCVITLACMPKRKRGRQPCPVPSCGEMRAKKSKTVRGYRWGCTRCYGLSNIKPDDLLTFSLEHDISSNSTPVKKRLRPRTKESTPKTQEIESLRDKVGTLQHDLNASRETNKRQRIRLTNMKDKQHELETVLDCTKNTVQDQAKELTKVTQESQQLSFEYDQLQEEVATLAAAREKAEQRLQRQQGAIARKEDLIRECKASIKVERE